MYGFMQDKKWYEDLAHVFIGLIPFLGWWREHRQWPPGNPYVPNYPGESNKPGAEATQLSRVADSYRDFLGYAIGGTIRTVILAGLLIWRW